VATDALETALDELYASDPTDFVTVRKSLAARLRSDGDAAAAKTLAAARRPTTAAAALNRLAREDPALVDDLLARSADLQAAYAGSRDGVRDATHAHRGALAAATEGALTRLRTAPTEAYRSQIRATLHAASIDDEAGEQLRRGRVVKEAAGPTGFGDLSVFEVPPGDEPAARRSPSRARADERAAARETAWRDAVAAADCADAAAAAADTRVEALTTELDDARREARVATKAASTARREADRLERKLRG
jgi:hypothetical protein